MISATIPVTRGAEHEVPVQLCSPDPEEDGARSDVPGADRSGFITQSDRGPNEVVGFMRDVPSEFATVIACKLIPGLPKDPVLTPFLPEFPAEMTKMTPVASETLSIYSALLSLWIFT